MSFYDCLTDAMAEGSVDRVRGERAQRMWREAADIYERQGWTRHNAEAMAGEDVKAAFKKEAGEIRHVYQAQLANARKQQLLVNSTPDQDLKHLQTFSVEKLDYEARALTRWFNLRVADLLKNVHRKTTGSLSDPAMMLDLTKEMLGEATGSAPAKAVARSIHTALNDMRLMANEAGAIIGKIDNWLPQNHDRYLIVRAGKSKWINSLIDGGELDWSKIRNHSTGRPFQASPDDPVPMRETQERLLGDIYDNIAYGKGSRDAVYGKAQGVPTYRQHAQERILHFKTADGWIKYNSQYGLSDPFTAIMSHVNSMANDIAAMRNFSPNTGLGLDYQRQLIVKRARERGLDPDAVTGGSAHAERMLRLFNGPRAPEGKWGVISARFFSNTRHLMTSAFLDKAVVASISDFNSMQLAAKAIGANRGNMFARYGETLSNMISEGTMSTAQLKRDKWVLDTLADPGVAMGRFQMEVPAGEIFERLSAASMRVQGLTHHTDSARYAFQSGFWGMFAENADKPFSALEPNLRQMMSEHGVQARDWEDFRAERLTYEPDEGATFLNPLYWRESTSLPTARADEVYLAMQGMVERWTEVAVPTNSLKAKAWFDPVAYGHAPGTPMYEMLKSGGMFKSFVAAFTINQYRMIVRQPTAAARALYVTQMAAGATVLGALSLQIGEILKGNDPMSMSFMENPQFWGLAALKGGGFGIIGDIVSTGQASWGGGLGSYASGPMIQGVQDVWGLTVSNAIDAAGDLASGRDIETGFVKEAVRLGKRYTPMGQTPAVGPAVDRLFWDQLHSVLDPEAEADFLKKAKVQKNYTRSGSWWMPGSPVPDRAPDLSSLLGTRGTSG